MFTRLLLAVALCIAVQGHMTTGLDWGRFLPGKYRPCPRFPRQGLLEPTNRIAGGSQAEIEEVPYMAAVLYYYQEEWRLDYGGAIISTKYILTAASDVFQRKPSELKVSVGDTFWDKGTVYDVTSITLHPKYDYNNSISSPFYANNLALLKLASELTLSSKVAILPLPQPEQEIPEGSVGLIAGWGQLSANGPETTELHKATVSVMNQGQCKKIHKKLDDSMFCAGFYKNGGDEACKDDDGGAFNIDGTLMGLSSMPRCGQAKIPSIYMRIPVYVDWIQSTMEAN